MLSACACGPGQQAGRDETFFNGMEAAIMTFREVMRFESASERENRNLCLTETSPKNNNNTASLNVWDWFILPKHCMFSPPRPAKPLGVERSRGMASLCLTKWNNLLQASQHRPGCLPHIALSDAALRPPPFPPLSSPPPPKAKNRYKSSQSPKPAVSTSLWLQHHYTQRT